MDRPSREIETLEQWIVESGQNQFVGSFPECTRRALKYLAHLEARNVALTDRIDALLEEKPETLAEEVERLSCRLNADRVAPDEPHKHTNLGSWPIG